jgi:hypothetical protein
LNRQRNWLMMTASGLCATLLLITGAQAADAMASTPESAENTVSQSHPSQLIASRKKKIRKNRVKVRARKTPVRRRRVNVRARKTSVQASSSSQPELTQTPPPEPLLPPPPPAPPAPPEPPVVPPPPLPPQAPEPNPPKIEATNQFSTTTKLEGQVIFGVTGTVAGDYSRNIAFGQRTRLDLKTEINGGTLTTRLQSIGLGLANNNPTAGTTAVSTLDGRLAATDPDGTTTSSVGMDAIKYEFRLSPQTQAVVSVNVGVADDFADTINPFFDIGDGGGGAITSFASRPSIYYGLEGVGGGIRHKLSDSLELSLGYLAGDGNNPALGSGLFGGKYGALAQLTFKPSENSKIGLTYTRTKDSDFTTGSTNANQGGDSNNFGVQGSFLLNPQFAVGGWAGYTQNQLAGVDRQIWNWAATVAAPDFGGEGNIAGLLVGQSPRVTSASDGTTDTKAGLHIEGFYQVKLSENLSITPGIIYLTAPNHDVNSQPAVIGALRTTFLF